MVNGQLTTAKAFVHPTFIRRQLATTRSQSLIFMLCVALSMVTLVALRGFGDSVDRALTRDARALIGADVVVPVSYTHLRAHETVLDLVCRLLLDKKTHNYTAAPFHQSNTIEQCSTSSTT